ncbi:MAG: hypothetical protein NVS3B25_08850 [Hymenobacter sp.]
MASYRMIHPHTELRFISPEIGFGVVATRLILKGTITWAFYSLDQVLSPQVLAHLHPLQKQFLEKYSHRDHRGYLRALRQPFAFRHP